jgi:hypothetical protein
MGSCVLSDFPKTTVFGRLPRAASRLQQNGQQSRVKQDRYATPYGAAPTAWLASLWPVSLTPHQRRGTGGPDPITEQQPEDSRRTRSHDRKGQTIKEAHNHHQQKAATKRPPHSARKRKGKPLLTAERPQAARRKRRKTVTEAIMCKRRFSDMPRSPAQSLKNGLHVRERAAPCH